jgi:hypothetical protein
MGKEREKTERKADETNFAIVLRPAILFEEFKRTGYNSPSTCVPLNQAQVMLCENQQHTFVKMKHTSWSLPYSSSRNRVPYARVSNNKVPSMTSSVLPC